MPANVDDSALVDIALATYNGERYIEPLLSSLVAQSHRNWRLYYRDDGSMDRTRQLLSTFAEVEPRVIELNSSEKNLGVIANFSTVLARTSAPYVLLADQDDYWYPHKVERMLSAIQQLERHNKSNALLVFSDLHVAASDLAVLHHSYISHQGLDALRSPAFSQLLTQNVAPGCSMIVNRALLEIALPIPRTAAMHDWWLILIASLFGAVSHVPEPLLAYRQHANNQIGAARPRLAALVRDALHGGPNLRSRLRVAQIQAAALLERYGNDVKSFDREILDVFSGLAGRPPVLRQIAALRHRLHKVGFLRDLGFYLFM